MDQPTIDGLFSVPRPRWPSAPGCARWSSRGTGGVQVFLAVTPTSTGPGFSPAAPVQHTGALHSARPSIGPFPAVGENWSLAIGGTALDHGVAGASLPHWQVARLTGHTPAHVEDVARPLDPGAPAGHPHRPALLATRYAATCRISSSKIDMISMAHSVEVRVPFLDPPLVSAVLASPSGTGAPANSEGSF